MTPALQNNSHSAPCEMDRLKAKQVVQVSEVLQTLHDRLQSLNIQARETFSTIWSLIAQATAPIAISGTSRQSEPSVQRNLESLAAAGFIWYDPDLQCVLECPPFSALTTHHSVKAFGWDEARVCSFIDAPLALLLYGPNTWMRVQSTCQHSGELLDYQLMMDDSLVLRTHTPLEAADWCIWVPAETAAVYDSDHKRHGATSFYTREDFETYRESSPDEPGEIYSFFEATAFSECLLRVYSEALFN